MKHFPFNVFSVVFGQVNKKLEFEVCELQRGLNIHLPFIELFNQKVYASLKHHGCTF